MEQKSLILLKRLALALVLKFIQHLLTPVRVYETLVICLNIQICTYHFIPQTLYLIF